MNLLVTGGGGFLGKTIIKQLLARGESVTNIARGDYPELKSLGVRCVKGDISDFDALKKAAQGAEAIIHTAAKAGIWGSFADYYQSNVVGTTHVIRAAKELGITKIVYTSSPSVIFSGLDQDGLDESTPYPARFLAAYPETKAIAEQLMVKANGPELATVSLRPHLIWGPGDPHIMPRMVERAKAKRLFRLGWADKLVDAVYVENAAHAHLLALDRIAIGSKIAGKVFFISNDEPWPLQRIIDQFLTIAGLPTARKTLPPSLAYAAGASLEWCYRVLGKMEDPPVTRFLASQMATSHWYNISAAKKLLDYAPRVKMLEGFERLRASWQEGQNAAQSI